MEMDSRERAQKQRLSEAGYRSINWSLDLKTHQFSCDQRIINDLLDTQHSFTHIKDFLRYMTPNKAAEMKRCFKFVIETGAIHYFNCSLVIPNQALTYVEFW